MHKKKCHLYSVVINLVVVAALFFQLVRLPISMRWIS